MGLKHDVNNMVSVDFHSVINPSIALQFAWQNELTKVSNNPITLQVAGRPPLTLPLEPGFTQVSQLLSSSAESCGCVSKRGERAAPLVPTSH